MPSVHCAVLAIGGAIAADVRIETDAEGRISTIRPGVDPVAGDLRLDTVVPGFANAHSHAFHRLIRGTTHADGGDFWTWRNAMYRTAALLDPALMFLVARAVFAEMLVSGYTAVGEFHYLHHRTDGSAYVPAHAMERAIADAARAVGIRLVLLDACYLDGGVGRPLEPEQRRFGDGSAAVWLERWHSLRELIDGDGVTLGAAIHSIRAVTPRAMSEIRDALDPGLPLHIHVSEQPQENADCSDAYGKTPVGVLADLGLLDRRLSLVHATHLTASDRELVGASGATAVMCPTTEADLADGIGPAFELSNLGTPIAIGSDQNAVIDPLLELRGLESGERLRSGLRGRFSPTALLAAGTVAGYASLGISPTLLTTGDPCDLVELDSRTRRTIGSAVGQLVLTADSSDVRRVVVAGRLVADSGRLLGPNTSGPEDLLVEAFTALGRN